MVRAGVLAAVLMVATGCTDGQRAWWQGVWDRMAQTTDPAEKAQLQAWSDQVLANYNAFVQSITDGHSCPQYFEMAMQAGFTPDQWQYPMSQIMWRESGCTPTAQNRSSSAAGLMQELSMWWDDCVGLYGTLGMGLKADMYDPWWNIQCAKHIYDVSGWRAWATYPP